MPNSDSNSWDSLRMYVHVEKGRIYLPPKVAPIVLRDVRVVAHIRKILLERQNGECLICGKLQLKNEVAFSVDHNHKTGEIRGVLCSNCNTGIGFLQDSPEILRNAIKYLEDHA